MTAKLPSPIWQFPNPIQADPAGEGLVAVGADLAPETILAAYQQGIFPWFSGDDPICWWSPEPRCIILPERFKPSKTLLRSIKKNQYTLTLNENFAAVMQACADARAHAEGTWIRQRTLDRVVRRINRRLIVAQMGSLPRLQYCGRDSLHAVHNIPE